MTINEAIALLTELKEEYETGDLTLYVASDAEGNRFSPLTPDFSLMVDDVDGGVRPMDVEDDEDEDNEESDLNKDVIGVCLWPI